MSLADFTAAHRDLLAVFGEPATYTPVAGDMVSLQALLDRNTAEVGEYGQTVAYRPSIAVLNADVDRPEQGDVIAFASSRWQVIRIANADDIVSVLWVEAT